jgi:hypothetical protein
MRFFAGLGLSLALAGSAWAAPTFPRHPSVQAIEASIARHGVHATVNALWDENRWDYVLDRIDGGQADWVELAGKLAPGTDAGAAEGLRIAFAFALPRNAPAVLAVVQTGAVDLADVCGVPFIEDTVRDLPAYERRAVAAVKRVRDPKLAATRAACLHALRAAQ